MKGRLEERMRKMAEEVENLRRENEALRSNKTKLQHDVGSSRNKQEESQSAGGVDANKEERKKMHQELRHLMDKYEEMNGSFVVDQPVAYQHRFSQQCGSDGYTVIAKV